MRILFICRDYRNKKDGGSVGTRKNLRLLQSIGAEVIEFLIPTPTLMTRLKNIIFRESYGNTIKLAAELKRHLSEDYQLLFFDGSYYGKYLRYAAERQFKICCFFHNVEYIYYWGKYKYSGRLQDKIMINYIRHNEKLCIKYATVCFTVNDRDSDDLLKIYGRPADMLLPTAFHSISKSTLQAAICESSLNTSPYVLFIGSKFYANCEGMNFLINDVANKIKYPIKVVGDICEVYRDKQNLPHNVEMVGVIDDLLPYYSNALAVLAPIFSGSGLKTKVVEGLRYGKYIIGTIEAFQGIPQNVINKVGKLCNDAHDYINTINNLPPTPLINENSLEIFNKLFSFDAISMRLKEYIRCLINEKR